ncbi:MAG: ATP-binding protein [bacterium]
MTHPHAIGASRGGTSSGPEDRPAGDSGLEIQSALDVIVRAASKFSKVSTALLYLLTENGQRLELRGSSPGNGLSPPEPAPFIQSKEPLGRWLANQKHPVHIPNVPQDPLWSTLLPGLRSKQSCVAVPLHASEGFLGALIYILTGRAPHSDKGLADLKALAAFALQHARLQQDLETFKARLLWAERHRTLAAMMRGVAHDLNNILGVIMTRAEFLMLNAGEPETLDELENIERASHQGANCVRRILEFTKTAHEFEISPVYLPEIVEETAAFTKARWRDEPAMREAPIDLNCELPADLPAVRVDVIEIQEALAELIQNAADAMPQGGTLTLSAEVEGGNIAIRVTDTGVGMDETRRERIFEPHFTTKGAQGTGLGLSRVLTNVQRNGGRMDVKSVPGHGTTVSIYLPLDPGTSSKTLVIAGKAEVRELLDQVLRMDGHEVVAVPSRHRAIKALQNDSRQFDLILMDRRMRDQGLSRAILNAPSEPTVISFSSWGRPSNEKYGGDSRDGDLDLSKPFSIAQVIETVRETLRQRRR